MPISDFGSYVTTGQQVSLHWTSVDADRVLNTLTALTLPGNYDLADFAADLTVVQAKVTEIEDLDNAFDLAAGRRDSKRASSRVRIIDFRDAANFRMKGSEYIRALPDTPHLHASEEKLLKTLDDMKSLWTRINAETGVPNFTAPLLLRGGYTLASFQTDLADLRADFLAVTDAENDLRLGRARRDDMLRAFRDRMVSYREAIHVEYGEDHVFTRTLPDVYAPGSGGGGPTAIPAVPVAPTLTNGPDGQVVANWPDVPQAERYRVFIQLVGRDLDFVDGGFTTISQLTFSSLPIGEIFRVKIAAVNLLGESEAGPASEIVIT